MAADRYESAVDKAIREAQERGEFDNLPGAGKPIRIRNPNDPNWWVRDLIEREQLEMPLPTSLALRREAERLPGELLELWREDLVRERIEDFNARVLEARRRPPDGPPAVRPHPRRRRAGRGLASRPHAPCRWLVAVPMTPYKPSSAQLRVSGDARR